MASKGTVITELQVTDMDRHYYAAHALTLAQHSSETEERLMMRLRSRCMRTSGWSSGVG